MGNHKENEEGPRNSSSHSRNSVHSNENCQNMSNTPYLWYPTHNNVKKIEYVRNLENEFSCLQAAFYGLSSHFSRLQLRVRQLLDAPPTEQEPLLYDLEQLAFNGAMDEVEPRAQPEVCSMGDVRCKLNYILQNLRNRLSALAEASELEGIEEETSEPTLPIPEDHICCCMRRRSTSLNSAAEYLNGSKGLLAKQAGIYVDLCEMDGCGRQHDEDCNCQGQSTVENSVSNRTTSSK